MVRSLERIGWSCGKLDLVWTFMVRIDDSAWFLKTLCCFSRFPFWWFSEPFPCDFLMVDLRPFSLGFSWGCMLEPFMVRFLVIPLTNPWEKVLDLGVFLYFRKVVFLVEILWFLLIRQVLVDQIVAMGCPWGTPSIPKVLRESVERIEGLGSGFGEVTRGSLFILSAQALTGWRIETATQRGGSEWEPIKILLKRDRGSNKMNTTSNTRLWLNYPSWSRPRSHWSATDPRNQQTAFRAKTHQRTQRKLAQFAACATPVRPVDRAG
jgi:hypothetical protein